MKNICICLLFYSLALNAMQEKTLGSEPEIVIASALIDDNSTQTLFSHHKYYRQNEQGIFECYKEFDNDSNTTDKKIYINDNTIAACRTHYSIKTWSRIDPNQRKASVMYALRTMLTLKAVTVTRLSKLSEPFLIYTDDSSTMLSTETIDLAPGHAASYSKRLLSPACAAPITLDPVTLVITGYAYNVPRQH